MAYLETSDGNLFDDAVGDDAGAEDDSSPRDPELPSAGQCSIVMSSIATDWPVCIIGKANRLSGQRNGIRIIYVCGEAADCYAR